MIGPLLAAAALTITSAAFTNDSNIPSKFTCDAGQTSPSPALAWKDAPAGTKSFVLIVHDPDVPQIPGGFTHWVLFDIPASAKELPEGFQVGSIGVSGNMGMRRQGWMGPCPPTGVHHYHFMLSALDVNPSGCKPARPRPTSKKRCRDMCWAAPISWGCIRNSPSNFRVIGDRGLGISGDRGLVARSRITDRPNP
jgi:Raf kinase inhibitor-like YbhB/YbcL family protein